jgi:hypothetical protein
MRDYLNATTAANHLVGRAEVVLLLGLMETMVPNASLQGQIHCHTMLKLYISSKVQCTSHFIQHEKLNSIKCEYANILTTLTHVLQIIN